MTRVPLLDLSAQVKPLKAAILKDWARALEKGQYINGPHVAGFEAELGAYCDGAAVAGCNSGTDALLLSMKALGVGPGDDVLVPTFSFFASAEAVSLLGARPVFCDVDPGTFLLSLAEVEKKVSNRTRAVMPVHLFGLVFDCAPLRALLKQKGRAQAAIVEDACQSMGAVLNGRHAGALGDAAGVSFYPTKNLSAAGDAGAVISLDKDLVGRVKRLRDHGMPKRYYHDEVGYNSRLDELQAAVLRRKLKRLDRWNAARRAHAARYAKLLDGLPIGLPSSQPGAVWHQYTIRVKDGKRDALKDHLAAQEIASVVFYPVCMHQQKPYLEFAAKLPVAEQAAGEVLSLPIFPEMTVAQQKAVAAAVRGFFHA